MKLHFTFPDMSNVIIAVCGGSEKHLVVREHQLDTPNVNFCCELVVNEVIELFFFHEPTVARCVCLEMLERPQPQVYFQQDETPLH